MLEHDAADIRFPDPKGHSDRKAVLVIRHDLEDDSKEVIAPIGIFEGQSDVGSALVRRRVAVSLEEVVRRRFGIGFCSHLPDKIDTAVLSNVVLQNSAGNVK